VQGSSQLSGLLVRWCEGDKDALTELTPLVYTELRRIARGYVNGWEDGAVVQPTALVHEAWIKLQRGQQLSLKNRHQFFGLAAKVMRDLLVDFARRRHAARRGGKQIHMSLSEAGEAAVQPVTTMLELDEALTKLGQVNPRYSQIVELRYFSGLSIEDMVEVLGVSAATIARDWNVARLWLRRELGQ
jgi:RNA polymerase sigma-70 factor (ECF subfamily)